MYAGTLLLVVLSILSIGILIHLAKSQNSNYENTISVSGMSEIDAAPDVAEFSFTVSETAKTTDAAQKVISEKVSNILDGLDELSISEKDIKTQSYSIYPKYEYVKIARPSSDVAVDGTVFYPGNDRKQVQTGFDVSQRVLVTVRNFDVVPQTLTLFADQGVQNLNGPNFEIENPELLKEEARAMAIDSAKEQARRLADDLGVHLGKMVSFNENNAGYPMPYYAKAELSAVADEAGAFQPELPAGENTISSNVTITYRIR